MQSKELISHIVKNYPILPSTKQLELVRSWQESSNKMALDKLVLSNIKAVLKEASRIKSKNNYISYDDLIQEGMAGLLKAADKFDSTQGVTFLTYAIWWIKANMRRYVMDYRSVVKMGTTRDDRLMFSNLSKALREAEAAGLIGERKINRVAEIIGVNKSSVNQMLTSLKGFDVRLDAPVKNDENETLKIDLVKDSSCLEDTLSSLNENTFLFKAISEIVLSLPDDEKIIIENRFLSNEPKTLRDLAKQMKISREWVRKLEIKALGRMKKRLASKYDVKEYQNV